MAPKGWLIVGALAPSAAVQARAVQRPSEALRLFTSSQFFQWPYVSAPAALPPSVVAPRAPRHVLPHGHAGPSAWACCGAAQAPHAHGHPPEADASGSGMGCGAWGAR